MTSYEGQDHLTAETSAADITPDQFARIRRHFGRHAFVVEHVTGEYAYPSGELRLHGVPASNTDLDEAEKSLRAAIDAARFIHPADDLDMSA